jgi:decaprenylphospho-beta-D-erythro-pentofuranosid-2-ulose 2-reductase
MARVIIIGATSAIAVATARQFAARGDNLVLAARGAERLASVAQDLRARDAAQVDEVLFSADAETDYEAVIRELWGQGADVLLIAHGSLPEQSSVQDDVQATRSEFEINALSSISLLAGFAGRFEERGRGQIVVISSVAGDRGRQSNYLYGASKAAVSAYLQGLRNRLHKSGVQVLTIKPGFVDSPMTAHLPKSPIWAQPDDIAGGILRGMDRGKDVIYLPGFWRYIMLVIKVVPEKIFKRLSL